MHAGRRGIAAAISRELRGPADADEPLELEPRAAAEPLSRELPSCEAASSELRSSELGLAIELRAQARLGARARAGDAARTCLQPEIYSCLVL